MIIGAYADLHATVRTPESRTDNYTETILDKFQRANDILENKGCSCVVNAGDFFDSEKEPYWLVNWFLDYFTENMWARRRWYYSVAGQHDQVNHTTNLANTPYQTLISSECIFHLKSKPTIVEEGVNLYGASWGEEVPKIITEGVNILVVHDLLVKEKIWKGQENVKFGIDYLKKNRFDFIICGDNHSPFFETYRNRILIMCGSIGRLKSNQKDYQPYIYTIDTEKLGDFESIPLPLKTKDVFSVTEKIKVKANKKELVAFIKKLNTKSNKDSFRGKLNDVKLTIKNEKIVNEINDIMKFVAGD